MPDIQIIRFDPSTGLGTVELGDAAKRITGIDLLAQIVALSYLRNPGQDAIDPVEGSGIRQDIGQISIGNEDEARLLVMQRTRLVEREVISRQTIGLGDPTEKLKSLTVLDVAVDLQEARVVTRVKIVNEAGQSTDILV
jgi:hypothetical protein